MLRGRGGGERGGEGTIEGVFGTPCTGGNNEKHRFSSSWQAAFPARRNVLKQLDFNVDNHGLCSRARWDLSRYLISDHPLQLFGRALAQSQIGRAHA
mgnify:CR=1 FL=1